MQNIQVLTLKLGTQTFGIDASKIHSICPPSPISKIPLSPSYIAGCSNIKGNIVTMIDMQEKMKTLQTGNENYLSIIIKYDGDLYSLMFNAVLDVMSINTNNLEKSDEGLYEGVLKGVYLNAQTPIMIIDPNLFFRSLIDC